MLSQETTENIKWILEVLQCYINDVFGGAETVLVNKDYKEIKALSLMVPNAKILLCQVHAHRLFRHSISASQCDVDDVCKLFRSKMHAPNTRVYDECVAFLRGAYPPGRGYSFPLARCIRSPKIGHGSVAASA